MTTHDAQPSRVILFNMVSLDGYFAGPNGDISWHNVDAEFNEFAIAQLKTAGALIFGRVTYEMMASYWPAEAAIKDDPEVAGLMNSLPKIAVSRTLARAEWHNTRLIKTGVGDAIRELKQSAAGNLLVFGSANLATSLTRLGLIDEYRMMVNPVVLGAGSPLFAGITERFALKLLSARTFRSGNVLLTYEPVRRA